MTATQAAMALTSCGALEATLPVGTESPTVASASPSLTPPVAPSSAVPSSEPPTLAAPTRTPETATTVVGPQYPPVGRITADRGYLSFDLPAAALS